MMKNSFISCLIIVLVLGFVTSVGAQGKVKPEDVIKRVEKASKFLSKKGKAGLEEFNSKDGRFVSKHIYPYVSNCGKNTAAAHPIKQELVGKDLSNLQDPKGNYFTLELCMVAQDKPEKGGWIKYWWPKPGESEPSQKFAYVKKAKDTPYSVVAGFWSDDYTVDELNAMLE